ncbi:MAG TPA: L,D-transpeptidase [Candidatus Saccharimonadales bacterium]|jgi:lipoprotein-anchoring transpeptidase ErfK/SrfK|nr:L,D-transpeptidase [Candidatus Saccharimonadales bacterium]
MVGNDFVRQQPRLRLAAAAIVEDTSMQSITPIVMSEEQVVPVVVKTARRATFNRPLDVIYHHSLIAFSLLFLLVGASGIEVGGHYIETRTIRPITSAATAKKPTIAGLSLTVPANQLQQRLQTITDQPASLTVGDQTVPISSDIIKSWLQISANSAKTEDYIYIKKDAIGKSLGDLANLFVKTPVNQVTVNHGGADQAIVAGRDGAKLSDPATLTAQADLAAKTVMNAKGLQFNTPLVSQAFSVVTPAAFPKLLEADVTTMTLYVYQNGQLINTFLTSDGAPATPTPLGEFHIYAKYATQDMSGYNANGTKYFQPRVPWVNYFSGGDAIHGVYWHPLSWFGAHNSSHGCVGVPVDTGEWIYNWAPIGTTVITHA